MTATVPLDAIAEQHAAITAARDAALPNAADVAKYRRYVLGTQPLTLSDAMKADLGELTKQGHTYVDNLCKLAVTTAADYLQIARIDPATEDEAARARLADFIARTWTLNNVPELEAKVNVATYRDADAAIVLTWLRDYPDPDNAPPGVDRFAGRVRLEAVPWWNGTTGIFVHYGPGNLADWAVNEWTEEEDNQQITRRIVYYPERFERAVRRLGGEWAPYETDGAPAVQANLDQSGRAVGLPVVHFPCFLIPSDAPGETSKEIDSRYGLSLLAGGALGVQDALNDAHYDLIVAARRSAFPLYTGTGVALPPKKGGQPGETDDLDTSPGKILTSPNPDSRFGILSPGDMSQLFNVIGGHTRVFARSTNTPMQIVNEEGTDAQSGVALLRMQLAAVRQARRSQAVLGARWGSVFHKATVIANAFGRADLDDTVPLVTSYNPIEASDIGVMAEVGVQLQQAGFPLAYICRKFGLTDDEIAQIMDEKKQERADAASSLDVALNQ